MGLGVDLRLTVWPDPEGWQAGRDLAWGLSKSCPSVLGWLILTCTYPGVSRGDSVISSFLGGNGKHRGICGFGMDPALRIEIPACVPSHHLHEASRTALGGSLSLPLALA